jgi:hypothetical protein
MTGSLTRPIADGAFAAPRHRVAIRHGWVSAARMQVIVALAIVPVGVSAIWLAAASEHVERPAATALYRCYLAVVPMLIALYWWRRGPVSRFGPLLIGFGLGMWVVSWQSSDRALAFDLGVLAEGPMTFLTFYLFLAFPSGRLETTAERLLMGAWAVVLMAFFLPWARNDPADRAGGPCPLRRRRRWGRVRSALGRARRRPRQHRRQGVGRRRRAGHRHGRGRRTRVSAVLSS